MMNTMQDRSNGMSTLYEESKEESSNARRNVIESPPAKQGRWELPPELEFTPVPGYKMVDWEGYQCYMANQGRSRVSENLQDQREPEPMHN